MKEYSLRCKIYLIALISIAYFITLYISFSENLSIKSVIPILFFIILSIISDSIALPLPKGGYISVTFAIDFAILLIFGYPLASWIAILGIFFNRKLGLGKKKPILVFFNSAQVVLSIIAAGIVIGAKNGNIVINNNTFLTLVIAAAVYFVVNTTTVTFALALMNDISPWKMWFDNLRWSVPNLLALSPIGILMGYAYRSYNIWGVSLFFVPLLVARFSFKLFLEMKEVLGDTVTALINAIEAKDKYTKGHSERVSEFVGKIARQMELGETEIEKLTLIALLHDIGKVGIPKQILNKKGSLNESEFSRVKAHPGIGADIVKELRYFGDAYKYIRYHHESFNGMGYPDKIRGKDIPLGARIIAVADAFDAMVSDRPYRRGMSWLEAYDELSRNAGIQHDPVVVQAFIKAYEVKIDEKVFSYDETLEVAATNE